MTVYRTNAAEAPTNPALALFRSFERTKLYDLVAAAPLVGWFGFCLSQQLPGLVHELAHLDLAAADARALASLTAKISTQLFFAALVVLLIMRHKPQGKTSGIFPRIAAIGGTYLGVGMVLLPPRDLSAALYMTSTLLILSGTLFSIYAALKLGRSISMMPEARRLVTAGPYGMIRHPLYLGEAVALVGLTLQFLSPLALALLAVQCGFQLVRMKNEERVLAGIFPEYQDYMARTARLVPGVY